MGGGGGGLKKFQNRKRYPTAILIGAQKCGTTTLKKFLNFHPSIVAASHEPQYFNKDANFEHSPNYQVYLDFMEPSLPNQITLEKTPYFALRNTPERVRNYEKFLGVKLKLILIVREPIHRAVSWFHHQLSDGTLDSGANITEWLLRKNASYIWGSKYGYHLNLWLKYFDRTQFLFLDGEKFTKDNPAIILRKVERFLQISNYFKDEDFGFTLDKPGFYCYLRQQNGCLLSRGKTSYPKRLTKSGFEILKKKLEPELRLFTELAQIKLNWTVGQGCQDFMFSHELTA
ncbi:heparan sulfate glucosamine 3-O-sulfotransferase 6-like [Symsagittifera roscoffensis]|uniref:heparan sulfate glucosamine 3-O-sulfotransferase 6-like n=1 Tax=Symsagittifera roscoffensis TaxID=84072 RepID=UPI00307C84D5